MTVECSPAKGKIVYKDRDERVLLGINFANRLTNVLGAALTITSVQSFKIFRTRDNADVTNEFIGGEPAPSASGVYVIFWTKKATGAEQEEGDYNVEAVALLSNGEQVMGIVNEYAYPRLVVGGA